MCLPVIGLLVRGHFRLRLLGGSLLPEVAILERFQQVQMPADVLLDHVDEVQRRLPRAAQALLLLGDMTVQRGLLGVLQHRGAFALRLGDHLVALLLRRRQRLLRAGLLLAQLLKFFHQHAQLRAQGVIFLIQGDIVVGQRFEKRIDLLHIVAAEDRLGERLLLNFLRCKH